MLKGRLDVSYLTFRGKEEKQKTPQKQRKDKEPERPGVFW